MAFFNKKSLLVISFIVLLNILLRAASITITATGDLMMGSWVQDMIMEFDYEYPFKNIDSIFQNSDIVFTNLEAPFGQDGEAFPKAYTFQVHPDLINVLTAGTINLVSLANNHIMDFGITSLVKTMDLLQDNNVYFAGAGLNLSQAREPALFQIKEKRIAFLAYSLTFPEEFWATDSSAGTCFPYHTFVYDDIRKLKAENDLVIISCHWGEELMDMPKKYQVELAHNMIDVGADIILGHHPHVVQGIERYNNKLVAYSLGNFVFGSYSKSATESFILKINWEDEELNSCEIIPINVFNEEVEFQPTPLTGGKKKLFFEALNKLSAELNKDPIVISSDGRIKWI